MKSLLVRGRKTISFYDSSIAGGGYITAVDPLFNPSPSTPDAVQPSQPPAPVQGDLSVSISGTTWHFVSVLFTSNTFPTGTVVTGIRYADGVQTSLTAYVGTALTISGASDTVGYRYIGAVSSTASIIAPGSPADTGYFNATYTKTSLQNPASIWSVSTTVNGLAVTTTVTGPASTSFYGFGTTNGVANQPFLQTTSSAGQFFITAYSAAGSYFYSINLTDDGTYASGAVVGNTVTAAVPTLVPQVAWSIVTTWDAVNRVTSTVISNPNTNSITTSMYYVVNGVTVSAGNETVAGSGTSLVTVPEPSGTTFALGVYGISAGSTYASFPGSLGNTITVPATGTPVEYPTSSLTSGTGGGVVCTSSSSYGTGFAAYNVGDGSLSTFWAPLNSSAYSSSTGLYTAGQFGTSGVAGEWVQYRLTGGSIGLTAYKVCGYNPTQCPASWSLFGSIDAATWVLVDSQVNQTTPNVSGTSYATYTLATQSAQYTYYRFVITQCGVNASGHSGLVAMTEWHIIGY